MHPGCCPRSHPLTLQDVPERALLFFQRALRVDPDHVKSQQALRRCKLLQAKKEEGNKAFRSGHLQQALDVYSEALSIDRLNVSTNAKLHCNRALVESRVRLWAWPVGG